MKFDAECNETTPAIVLNRLHEHYEILTKKWRQKLVEIQWYLNHISSSDDNEEVESKRHTSLDILIILNMFLPDYVNDKS